MFHLITRDKCRSLPLLLRKSSLCIQETACISIFNSNYDQFITKNLYNKNNRPFSGITRGTDLLADSLSFSDKPKIIFDGHSPTGIDVFNIVALDKDSKQLDPSPGENLSTSSESEEQKEQLESIHMNGSCLAFPHSCFLWKPRKPQDVTLESLEIVMRVDPPIELLFIGCDSTLPPRAMNKIKKEFKRRKGIIVEQMNLSNAMATFNILNGEDRRVAAALILPNENKIV